MKGEFFELVSFDIFKSDLLSVHLNNILLSRFIYIEGPDSDNDLDAVWHGWL